MSSFDYLEGETPIEDISGLIPKDSIKTRADLNRAEALNIAEPFIKYLASRPSKLLAPFDFHWFYQLHHEMFGQVWAWAGVTRQSELNIGIPASQVDSAIFELAHDLAYWEKQGEMSIEEQTARLHHRAVCIHPFLNGNGRWSRLLANIWMYQHSDHLIVWPEAMIGMESIERSTYLGAMKHADHGVLAPLIELQRKYMELGDDDESQPDAPDSRV